MSQPPENPFSKLDQQEIAWLFGILKDACRERLEKNLISQVIEERLFQQHGVVPGRLDPRPKLAQWEPRYRKLLAVATELHELVGRSETGTLAALFAEQFIPERPKRKARKQKT